MIKDLKKDQKKRRKPKSFSVKVRLNEDEKKAFEELAKTLKVKPSHLHRRLIREIINNETDYFTDGLDKIIQLKNELSAIGRNLNQLVKLAHKGNNIKKIEVLDIIKKMEKTTLKTRGILVKNVQKTRNRTVKFCKNF